MRLDPFRAAAAAVLLATAGQAMTVDQRRAHLDGMLKNRPPVPSWSAGPVNNGVIYDYLRLELDESAAVAAMR